MNGTQVADARHHLAWLMWCYQEGYTEASDRAVGGGNWLLGDPAEMHPDDAALHPQLLAMADEVLAALSQMPSAPMLQAFDLDEHNGLHYVLARLEDETIDKIARRVVELLGEQS